MNDFNSHIDKIKQSIKHVRLYEIKEKKKDIMYHIKKLPNELSREIFFYLSLMPFNKQDFIKEYNKRPLFHLFNDYNEYSRKHTTHLLGYNRHNRPPMNIYNSDIRISETAFIFAYQFRNSINHKIKQPLYKERLRFINVSNSRFYNKTICKSWIKEHIPISNLKMVIKLLNEKNKINNQFYSRLALNDLNKVMLYYTLHFY